MKMRTNLPVDAMLLSILNYIFFEEVLLYLQLRVRVCVLMQSRCPRIHVLDCFLGVLGIRGDVPR